MQLATIIDGQKISDQILEEIKNKIVNYMVKPRLDIIHVGTNSSSQAYVEKKKSAGERVGIRVVVHEYDEQVSYDQLKDDLTALSSDAGVHGIILQLPAPFAKESDLLEFIDPRKDVDGLNPYSQGLILHNRPRMLPATCRAVLRVIEEVAHMQKTNLRSYLEGKKVCIINRSLLLGKPLAAILLNSAATLTVAHSKTRMLEDIIKVSDVIISATSRQDLMDPSWVKFGALLIDAGFTKNNDVIYGDIDVNKFSKLGITISPVPGGVGPLGVAYLLDNTTESAISKI